MPTWQIVGRNPLLPQGRGRVAIGIVSAGIPAPLLRAIRVEGGSCAAIGVAARRPMAGGQRHTRLTALPDVLPCWWQANVFLFSYFFKKLLPSGPRPVIVGGIAVESSFLPVFLSFSFFAKQKLELRGPRRTDSRSVERLKTCRRPLHHRYTTGYPLDSPDGWLIASC